MQSPGYRRHLMQLFRGFLLLVFCVPVWAVTTAELLQQSEAPDGVVFEIVEDDEDDLGWALPATLEQIRALRERFPDLEIAVVSHGREMFALKTDDRPMFPTIHDEVRSLSQDDGIPVHVCGTHASWFGDSEDDFPDYVDVVPAGPLQIRQYEELGFVRILIEEP